MNLKFETGILDLTFYITKLRSVNDFETILREYETQEEQLKLLNQINRTCIENIVIQHYKQKQKEMIKRYKDLIKEKYSNNPIFYDNKQKELVEIFNNLAKTNTNFIINNKVNIIELITTKLKGKQIRKTEAKRLANRKYNEKQKAKQQEINKLLGIVKRIPKTPDEIRVAKQIANKKYYIKIKKDKDELTNLE